LRSSKICISDLVLFSYGSTPQLRPRVPRFEGYESDTITHTHTHFRPPSSSDRIVQRPLPTQHTINTRQNIHPLRGTRTCDPSKPDLCLTPHGHQHRLVIKHSGDHINESVLGGALARMWRREMNTGFW
jgi:hypothetical protein